MELSASRRRTRLTRDITGPSPHIVGIIAKNPAKKHGESLVTKLRLKEEENEAATKVLEYNHQMDLKTAWILATEKKIHHNTIQRRVNDILQKQKHSLEERRDRLRSLLSTEEEEYISEMISKQETTLEKQARMREKARKLRERREEERMAFVEEKLDQRWRDQCEELRSVETKHRHGEIAKQRSEQIRLKDETQKRLIEEEAMYAKMWKEDYLSKCQREVVEEALQIERNKEMLELLNVHMAAKQKEQEELRILREKEAELLKEQNALRAMEEERQRQEKRQRQDDTRACLNYSLKLKMKKRVKEVQEELALDMKILEQMLIETTNEAMENLQRKNQMRDEVATYRQHLEEQAKQEREREKEFDAAVTAELEKQWAGRLEQWRKERQARRKLMQEVMDTRKKQLEEQKAAMLREQAENEAERQKIIREFEEHLKQQREEEEERKKVAVSYQSDLKEQMKYQELSRQMERQHLDEELTWQKEAETLYRRRVEDAVDKLKHNKTPRSTKGLTVQGHGL